MKDNSMMQITELDEIKPNSFKLSEFTKTYTLNENKIYRYEVGKFAGNNTPYMLKIFNKSQVESRKFRYMHFDKRCMQDVSCPFLGNVVHAFMEDDSHVFVMRFIDGSPLYEVINTIGLLSSTDCQFYTASILIILDCLRESKFVHRDLKPENFLVDPEGFLHLFDCSTVKHFSSSEKTTTIMGTPHYMAPEIILAKGYLG